ncbi:hypothetical protein [Microcoleus sp. bin38.metabat.b11b12b14.051]|uniref:hypothetical protein n=1 Tax=Microcoleus sp. bin38.metabat.b11b12b14.051 TaxID=2742709 RepID=UPI0025FCCAB1|nr:hypothetical protein [Microcoleus sp. bin38.metabat.b11b12b14.051]
MPAVPRGTNTQIFSDDYHPTARTKSTLPQAFEFPAFCLTSRSQIYVQGLTLKYWAGKGQTKSVFAIARHFY